MNNFSAVLEKINEIREIVESQPVGTYIYRGEPEHYKDVSSNLYRFCQEENLPIIDPAGIKNLLEQSLKKIRRFTNEEKELEFADMTQHYGGLTDRIDFTNDYLIALFFACYGSTEKNGRIIALERGRMAPWGIRFPRTSNNRVIKQKSVFVIPHEGFIDITQDGIVVIDIPKSLKSYILRFLRKHHGISIETIYEDFEGSIRLQRNNLKATSYVLHGNDCLLKDQYDLAVKKFDEAIKLDSNRADAYQGRGIAYTYKDEDKLAIENFSDAIEMSQYNAKFYLSRGNVYTKIGQYENAIADFHKADREQIPRDDIVLPRIYLSLGSAYAKSENYEKAIEIFDHAIRILPDFEDRIGWHPSEDTYNIAAALYNSRGNLYAEMGKDDLAAIACFEKAIKLKKYNFIPYLNLSTVYMKINEHEKAIKCYDRLVATMAKSNFATYLCRGHFYVKIRKYEKAIDDFNEAIRYLKSLWYHALISFYRDTVYAEIGNFKNAIDNLSKAVKWPHYYKWIVAAFYNRYSAYLEMGNIEKANEDLNEIKELNSELVEGSSPSFLFSMEMVPRAPDMYLYPSLHGWEVDLSL